jgi:hypothetical protein
MSILRDNIFSVLIKESPRPEFFVIWIDTRVPKQASNFGNDLSFVKPYLFIALKCLS